MHFYLLTMMSGGSPIIGESTFPLVFVGMVDARIAIITTSSILKTRNPNTDDSGMMGNQKRLGKSLRRIQGSVIP